MGDGVHGRDAGVPPGHVDQREEVAGLTDEELMRLGERTTSLTTYDLVVGEFLKRLARDLAPYPISIHAHTREGNS